jgi:hypothetical protein
MFNAQSSCTFFGCQLQTSGKPAVRVSTSGACPDFQAGCAGVAFMVSKRRRLDLWDRTLDSSLSGEVESLLEGSDVEVR